MHTERKESKHMVQVLDLSELAKHVDEWLKENNVPNVHAKPDHTYGLLTKGDKHYLICSEGVWFTTSVENEEKKSPPYITWYPENPGFIDMQGYRMTITWDALTKHAAISDTIRLDLFIRNHNSRLDTNLIHCENWLKEETE